MIVKRVEKHIFNRNSSWYSMLKDKCHEAKNIYNHGNYVIRQEFINSGKYLNYYEVEKILHGDLEYPDYWNWGLANSSQQVLRVLDKNWKSFFQSMKDWKAHPEKYKGRPKPPKYLKKDGLKEFSLTTNQAKLKEDNLVHFPKSMNGFIIKPKFIEDDYEIFQQCRIKPENDRIVVELIYTKDISDQHIDLSGNYGSIDLGIDNFITFVDNGNNQPIIINGKGLKSKNKYFNELIAKNKSKFDKTGNSGYSHLLYSITNKRNDFVEYFMHNASSYIIDLCKKRDITCLVIGKNKDWKNEVSLGKLNNQTFVQIPYNSFIQKLAYKCQENKITLFEVDEAYTSGTSFLDDELATKETYDKTRRIKRGLFRSNQGKLINADVNAACQIMKKVFPNAFDESYDDRGWVMQPLRVNIIKC